MKLLVIGPHFEPDTAPTGHMLTGIVAQLAARGHEVHVITSLPWYRSHRLEPGWEGRLWCVERRDWGTITRVHPFPAPDKRSLWRRALGFGLFSLLVAWRGLLAGGAFRRLDVVVAMSPPITLGPTAGFIRLFRRARAVLNVQDIFPDAAIETGAIRSRRVIGLGRMLESIAYRSVDVVTVLSDEMADNVAAKVPPRVGVQVIPNFVETDRIQPIDRQTSYRRELGLGDELVVMYAGNVGYSQSLSLLVEAARALPQLSFVINGDGVARRELEAEASDLANLHLVGYQPADRLAEVLASADVQVVPLRSGLARVSVPSKVYSALAAARAVVAAIDADTEIPRLLETSGAGISVPPDDPAAFIAALAALDLARCQQMGAAGRRWIEANISPERVGARYEELCRELCGGLGAAASRPPNEPPHR